MFISENQIIGMLIVMAILAFFLYLFHKKLILNLLIKLLKYIRNPKTFKSSGINKYYRKKDYKKETKDESDEDLYNNIKMVKRGLDLKFRVFWASYLIKGRIKWKE